jgi:hypothetical protein
MPRRLLVVALLAPSVCLAQVTGTFSLDKTTFAPSEPVFLYLTLHNSGKEPEEISHADPYSFCSGYKIHITRDSVPQPACFRIFAGDCMSGAITLAPGASRTERILLNYRNDGPGDLSDPVSIPGYYTVEATRGIAYAPIGQHSDLFISPNHSETHETFHLRVDDALELSPAVYAPYVQQLDSKDEQIRLEAARTLATIAPPALEPLLLTFATSKDYALKQFAPLALSNLSTKASIAALAQMLVDDKPGIYESMTAAEDLGKTHDPAWLPLLLEISNQHESMYLRYAADSGGDTAIAPLLTRLRSPDPSTRSSAIYALGYTGSRAAVPILISLLPTQAAPDEASRNTAISADAALMQLTHLYPEPGTDWIPTWHSHWQNWWLANNQTAAIYKPEDCVADTKLP